MKFNEKGLAGLIWKPEHGKSWEGEQGLIVAVGNIAMCVDDDCRYVFATHSNPVRNFCLHNNKLYYSVVGTIFEATEEEEVESKDGTVNAIESHDSKLYFAASCNERDLSSNTKYAVNAVFELGRTNIVVPRNSEIKALKSHDGNLYDAGIYPGIQQCFGPNWLKTKHFPVVAMETHSGRLYYATTSQIFTADDDMKVCERNDTIHSLKSHNKVLIDTGDYSAIHSSVHDKLQAKPTYKFKKRDNVYAIGSIPMTLWEQLAGKGEKI